jgi:hypothetical protein
MLSTVTTSEVIRQYILWEFLEINFSALIRPLCPECNAVGAFEVLVHWPNLSAVPGSNVVGAFKALLF